MKRTLPGQLDLPAMPEDQASLAQQLANAPILPAKEQKPCDVGLFGDDASQLDLADLLVHRKA